MKVSITTKMVGVPVFDSTKEYALSAQLYAVADHIKREHGGTVDSLKLWKSKVEPGTILRDLQQPLSEIFRNEENTDGSTPQLYIYYDFSPVNNDCAILNVK
ncbi:hypothetical protein ABB37_01083 [Leptomonas pyrrhocoris]|uniref:Uncharacterized protein n=1 Tax=Leptomonas pyrrhocoris TaxID=157538 RepID=A0A0M9G8B5_LEPPY|nr:hypothetical protein ABB37_01083 [Leptomonas pyrrhocoris]XP_015662986.1 hypothetical protein ABB37_01083 [Leptomonas pyrrhocoris]KPA84546.1 hypothetical protein ABB37_01083 [Leptomonas pyrrhocoris]KPA84547.1 hypothetical protein ABB37_01083 [Leptomonas pyrrhocoris]|eukprot:XP_015662985.1 hypothetical protein ABB37_01083 [Leptomonas pyrrhocoris]